MASKIKPQPVAVGISYTAAAHHLIDHHYTFAGQLTLRWWQGEFWEWRGHRYALIPPKSFENRVGTLMARTRPELALKLDSRTITEITFALRRICEIPPDVPMGSYIQPGYAYLRYHQLTFLTNGILDLDRALQEPKIPLMVHDPRWFNNRSVGYPYRPSATCPKWLSLLDYWMEGDQSRIDLLQEFFGLCLTTNMSFECLMIWEGPGGNGKGVASVVLQELVGPANCSFVPFENFGDRFEFFNTFGKTLNISGDAPELDRTAEGVLKQFVTGENMQFTRKYRDPISARPTAKLLVATNTRPFFSDRTEGVWRRVFIIPWQIIIPREKWDLNLKKTNSPDWPFHNEMPGIFNWALAGYQRLMKIGDFTRSVICEDLKVQHKHECNPAAVFLDSYMAHPNLQVSTMGLYRDYTDYCHACGHQPLNIQKFQKEVFRVFPGVCKGFSQDRTHRIWKGVGLRGPLQG